MFKNDEDFGYSIKEGFDYIIEEKGNQFTALRQIDWGNKGIYRLDLRKYYSQPDGERMSKGISFMTDEGPGELVKVLLRTGHCETYDALECIKDREDFRQALNSILGDKDEFYDKSAGELKDNYYDPKELLA